MSKKKKLTEMVGVMFTPKTLMELDRVTDDLEVSKSEFIREIVEQKLFTTKEEVDKNEKY